jgi:hypothetical protein
VSTARYLIGDTRDAIGIGIDERNAQLAVKRCGLFITVVDTDDDRHTA